MKMKRSKNKKWNKCQKKNKKWQYFIKKNKKRNQLHKMNKLLNNKERRLFKEFFLSIKGY